MLITLSFGAVAAVLSWWLVGQLVRLAPQMGLVDRPNDRSSHTRVTPRGGGIGIVFTVVAVTAVALVVLDESRAWAMAALLGASVFIAVISLWDDFRSLSAGVRFACHLAGGVAVVLLFGSLAKWELPGEFIVSWPAAIAVTLTLIWIVGLTNVYNFMDGIDGIAGVQGVVAGLAWTVVGLLADWSTLPLLAVALTGASAGFLVHNWAPAKIFMGDVSSAFLGFLLAALPVVALHESGHSFVGGRLPIFAALVVWPFVGDGVLTFLRRLFNREPVWKAHRSHLYQRLVQTGWSHARVSSLYGAWAAACAALGMWWLHGDRETHLMVLLFPLASLAAMFAFVAQRERKRQPA